MVKLENSKSIIKHDEYLLERITELEFPLEKKTSINRGGLIIT